MTGARLKLLHTVWFNSYNFVEYSKLKQIDKIVDLHTDNLKLVFLGENCKAMYLIKLGRPKPMFKEF